MNACLLGRLTRGERDLASSAPATRRALQAMFSKSIDELQRPWAFPHSTPAPERHLVVDPTGAGPERNLFAMAAQRARQHAMLAAEPPSPAVARLVEAAVRHALGAAGAGPAP